jgi:hypothetical protein
MNSLSIPLLGIIYGLAAVAFFLFGLTRRGGKTAQAIAGVLLVVAALNAYAENRAITRIIGFRYATLVLIVGFALAYTLLCLRLMEQIGIRNRRVAFLYSYLPFAYVCLLGVVVVALRTAKLENPALGLYVWVTFAFALHVPLFAAGKSKVAEFARALHGASLSGIYPGYALWSSGTLGLLLIAVFFAYWIAGTDWRLYSLNAVVTSLLLLLCVMARPPK